LEKGFYNVLNKENQRFVGLILDMLMTTLSRRKKDAFGQQQVSSLYAAALEEASKHAPHELT
jgi:Mrp family chromosome partitioning ATPase